MRKFKLADQYGAVDVRKPLSKRYTQVCGRQASVMCKKLGIPHARALTGFSGRAKYGFRPCFDGVVVSTKNGKRLAAALRFASLRKTKSGRTLMNRPAEVSQEELGFVSTILRQPKENTNWLVYADWLQEHDDERTATKIRKAVRAGNADGTESK